MPCVGVPYLALCIEEIVTYGATDHTLPMPLHENLPVWWTVRQNIACAPTLQVPFPRIQYPFLAAQMHSLPEVVDYEEAVYHLVLTQCLGTDCIYKNPSFYDGSRVNISLSRGGRYCQTLHHVIFA